MTPFPTVPTAAELVAAVRKRYERRPHNEQAARNAEIVRRRDEGATWAVLGRAYGITGHRVKMIYDREVARRAEEDQV